MVWTTSLAPACLLLLVALPVHGAELAAEGSVALRPHEPDVDVPPAGPTAPTPLPSVASPPAAPTPLPSVASPPIVSFAMPWTGDQVLEHRAATDDAGPTLADRPAGAEADLTVRVHDAVASHDPEGAAPDARARAAGWHEGATTSGARVVDAGRVDLDLALEDGVLHYSTRARQDVRLPATTPEADARAATREAAATTTPVHAAPPGPNDVPSYAPWSPPRTLGEPSRGGDGADPAPPPGLDDRARPAPEPVHVADALLFVGALALTLLVLRLLRWLALALFSRVPRVRALDHPARRRIHDLAEAEPGLHKAEVGRRCGVEGGRLQYHLGVLEQNRLLVLRTVGRYTCVYPTRRCEAAPEVRLRSPTARRTLAAIRDRPGRHGGDLARELGLSRPTLQYHLDRLDALGLVARRRDRRVVRWFPPAPMDQPNDA